MELDEYKIIVRQRASDTFEQKGRPELPAYSRRRAQSTIDAMKRSLRIEIAFALLFVMFDSYLIVSPEYDYFRIVAAGMLIFCCSFIFYIIKLLRYIQFQQLNILNIKAQMEGSLIIFNKFIKLYFQLTTVMTPLIFLLVLVSVYWATAHPKSSPNLLFTVNSLWIYICAAGLWSFIMYFFTKWYIKKLYGTHVINLRRILKELQEEE